MEDCGQSSVKFRGGRILLEGSQEGFVEDVLSVLDRS